MWALVGDVVGAGIVRCRQWAVVVGVVASSEHCGQFLSVGILVNGRVHFLSSLFHAQKGVVAVSAIAS